MKVEEPQTEEDSRSSPWNAGLRSRRLAVMSQRQIVFFNLERGAQQGEGELPFGEQLMAAYKKVGPMERIVLLGLWGQNHSRVRLTYKRTGAKKNSLAKLCVMITENAGIEEAGSTQVTDEEAAVAPELFN
ncbi:hypothetical protein AXG93_2381s1040 [Marchantia polymorpha subsp. ruderalis]|uniref:Uncharacterized protein n=1 Tax=Marchantia polymorpha subsp. ruderalis TaxID=1480154 RepID=A0A176VNB2_MARPO|nr:hypothetical protein AXG93_2381s1040 [Marchantia polymorpha subsp. ruderalis]